MNNWKKIGVTAQLGRSITYWAPTAQPLTDERQAAIISVLQGEAESDTLTEEEMKWLEQKVQRAVSQKLIQDHLSSGGAVQHSSSVH